MNELYQKIYMQNVGRDWVLSNSEGVNKVISENGMLSNDLSAHFKTNKQIIAEK